MEYPVFQVFLAFTSLFNTRNHSHLTHSKHSKLFCTFHLKRTPAYHEICETQFFSVVRLW